MMARDQLKKLVDRIEFVNYGPDVKLLCWQMRFLLWDIEAKERKDAEQVVG